MDMAATTYPYERPTNQSPERSEPLAPRQVGTALGWGTWMGIVAGLAANLCLATGLAFSALITEGDAAIAGFAVLMIGFFGSIVATFVGGFSGGVVGMLLAVFRAENYAPVAMAIGAAAFPTAFGLGSWFNFPASGNGGPTGEAVLQLGAFVLIIAAFGAIGYQAGRCFAAQLAKSSTVR